MADRFRRAKKARRAAEEAGRRLPALRARLADLEALAGLGAGDAALLEREAARRGVGPPRPPTPRNRARPVEALPWRTFTSAEGWDVLVGKDARGNDRLTLRHARPNDLFLHVRGAPGSHVIVPTPTGQTVPLPTLLEAAELAVWYSARRGHPRVEVDHVPRRHVRKSRGAPPGEVVLDRIHTLVLDSDPARRARILGSRRK